MTAAPPRPLVVPGRATPAVQQQRRLRWSAVMAGVRARAALAPAASERRRRSLQLCAAARLLTALGIRVDVVQPPAPWPRHLPHRLVARNEAGLLGDLALLTAVPRTTPGWAEVADRVLPIRTSPRAVAPADGVACPVTVAYRTARGPLPVPPRTLDDVVAIEGLVIEVRLFPARSGHVPRDRAVALRRVRGSWRRPAGGPAPIPADRRPVPLCERSPAVPVPSPLGRGA
ncbi:UNVERIFIED_ORG: hypothetical protein E4P37_13525 [Bacillus sp. AZ43]